jgi:hypothetical protein
MKYLKKIFAWFHNEISGNVETRYVDVAPAVGQTKVVPFARTDVPNLGKDHAQLIKKAELLFESDHNRYKWLMAIHHLQSTSKVGWILKPTVSSKKPNWGLNSTGTV